MRGERHGTLVDPGTQKRVEVWWFDGTPESVAEPMRRHSNLRILDYPEGVVVLAHNPGGFRAINPQHYLVRDTNGTFYGAKPKYIERVFFPV